MDEDTLFDDVGDLLDAPKRRPVVVLSPAKLDALARILAGFRYPGAKKYEALPAAKRDACRHAAETALTYLQNQPD